MTKEEQLVIENHILKQKVIQLERYIQRIKTPIEQSHYIRCVGCNRTMHGNIKVAIRGKWDDEFQLISLRVIASDHCEKCKEENAGSVQHRSEARLLVDAVLSQSEPHKNEIS